MKFSSTEKKDLVKAWIVIALAFGIVINGGLGFSSQFAVLILFSGITVGLGFLLHEIAHKYVAIKYGCWAEFRAFDTMLMLALLCSFFGFVFAAPGAVMIHGHYISRKQNGLISAAGPATNYVLALLFLVVGMFGGGVLQTLGSYGFMINAWLGLFNMIPFGQFDGRKILDLSPWLFGGMVGVGFLLMGLQSVLA